MWLPLSLKPKTLSLQSGTQLFNAREVEHMALNTVLRQDRMLMKNTPVHLLTHPTPPTTKICFPGISFSGLKLL
jgi:hypothetical protein